MGGTPRRLRPRRTMQPCAYRQCHQRVVTRVELDLVDTVPEAVVAVQLRRVDVGQPGMGLHGGTAQLHPQMVQTRGVQRRGVERESGAQTLVAGEQVVVDQRSWLVKDFVGRADRQTGHGNRQSVEIMPA